MRFLLIAPLALVLTGCTESLETGYAYHPLKSTPDQRRAYYAPEFTPESHADKSDSAPTLNFAQ